MRKKSKELLDMALRELNSAISEGKEEVKFILRKDFSGKQKNLQKFSDQHELKKVTMMLREEFSDYELKSEIYGELNCLAIVCFEKGPCKNVSSYSLIWKLSLQSK